MRTRILLFCVWVIFVLRGIFYISYLPLWEGMDEWAHFAVVQSVAAGHLLVDREGPVSSEVETSLEQAPSADGAISYGAFWRLSAAERRKRQDALEGPVADGPPSRRRAYEGQQAPLYYWTAGTVYKFASALPLLSRVWIVRLFGLVLSSAIVPLSFLSARRLFSSGVGALSVACLITATPELMMTISHVGNDALGVALGGLLLWATLRWKEKPGSFCWALVSGCALGAALLTKSYFLALIPPVILVAAISANRRTWRQCILLLATAALISGWWYVRTWTLTHSISGEQIEVAAGFRRAILREIPNVDWVKAADFAAISHVWLGNWSFLVVRSWMYRFFEILAVLAVAGLARRFVSRAPDAPSPKGLLWLMFIYFCFVLALAYHVVQTFQVQHFSGALAQYLVAISAVEAILMLAGLEAIAPRGGKRIIVPGAVVCLAGLECFALHFIAMPYYAGLTIREPDGRLHALPLHELAAGGLPLMLSRLAVNKASFLTPSVMETTWALFVLATLALIATALLAPRWGSAGPGRG